MKKQSPNTLKETKVDTRKQRRKPSQKQKEPQLARSTKVDTRQTTNTKNSNNCAQKKRKCKQNNSSHCNSKNAQGLDNVIILFIYLSWFKPPRPLLESLLLVGSFVSSVFAAFFFFFVLFVVVSCFCLFLCRLLILLFIQSSSISFLVCCVIF